MELSICVPTYNRIDYLKEMVGSIIDQITTYGLFNEIEVVVSNNNSTDGTREYLYDLTNKHPQVCFRINNSQENIGFIKNLLKSAETAQAKYWWFIGDDDSIPQGALPSILKELSKSPGTPVFIFNQEGTSKIIQEANISIQQCAENYYYYMGNAVTICNTQLSKQVIATYYEDIISTCWPQTYIFFMSMYLSKEPEPVRLSKVVAFKFNIQNNINTSSYYFYAQFFSLFQLGYLLADKSNNPSFVNWFPEGIPFINGIKKYAWIFAINKEYRFFDFEDEQKEFDTTFKEAAVQLLPKHKKYLSLIKAYNYLPDFFFKYYAILGKTCYMFIYTLVRKKKILNPFSFYKKELNIFNTFKEEKIKKKQLKYMHSTGKNDW